MRQIVAWTILWIAGAVFITAPLWLWWITDDIDALYVVGTALWVMVPAAILIGWALSEIA